MAFLRYFGLMLTFTCLIWAQDTNDVPFFLDAAQDSVPQSVRHARDRITPRITMIRPGTIPPRFSFATQPELPYADTDTVVLGNITGNQPFLTADGKGIYTEYTLEVVETVKSTPLVSASAGDSLILLRPGGVGRLPDGRVVKHHIINDVIPIVGQQYLVFLKYHVKREAFDYAKMWLVQNGVMKAIFPDDVSREHSGESEYAGKPLREVLDSLRDIINKYQ
jgi:hypothetical protein